MERTLDFGTAGPDVGIDGSSASVDYAQQWLEAVGITCSREPGAAAAVWIRDGDRPSGTAADQVTEIRLWDFQVGRRGTGAQASAISGVSWVLGWADEPPLVLPADLPEKWCGLFGATLALVTLLEADSGDAAVRHYDVSAADVLRAFADQNAGNHAEVVAGWRRNGRVAVEHGGIYPQGFFPCADGFVAMVGRSRKDWYAIRKAIGWPAWADDPRFEDPFAIAEDSAEVDELLTAALAGLDRDRLLEQALLYGATIAPVFSPAEARARNLVRPSYHAGSGVPFPFEVRLPGPAAAGPVPT
ncbi:MAG: CoA transferase [Nocardioidaceae bacterium]